MNWDGARTAAGYPIFTDFERRKVYAHRWLVEQLLGRSLDRDQHVMHACDNPSCVNPLHLSVGTCAENERDKVRKGRQARGEGHGRKRLSDDAVREMRSLRGAMSQSALGRKFGISQAHVSKVLMGDAWKHVH